MNITSRQKYKALRKEVVNWPLYFYFKFFGKEKTASFRLRKSSNVVKLPFAMLRVFKEIFMQDEYDLQFVKQHLKADTTVLDIGANIGLFSAWIANHFPNQSVQAYEPFEGNHEMLMFNTSLASEKESKITIVKKAVTGKPADTVDFYINLQQPFSDSASCIPGFFNNQHKVTVPAVPLQVLLVDSRQRIGLLKLDCEGSEYDILFNTPANLFKLVDAMIIETHDLEETGKSVGAVLHFLEENDFQCRYKRVDKGLHLIWAYNRTVFEA